MIVKTKRGYYVYGAINKLGRRKRIAGPFTTYNQAVKINNTTKKRKGKRKSR